MPLFFFKFVVNSESLLITTHGHKSQSIREKRKREKARTENPKENNNFVKQINPKAGTQEKLIFTVRNNDVMST